MEITDLLGQPGLLPVYNSSGGGNDTQSLATALANNPLVVLKAGSTWKLDSLTLNANQKLWLMDGVQLKIGSPLVINSNNAHLWGPNVGIFDFSNGAQTSHIQWVGGPNASVIQFGSTSISGCSIKGVSIGNPNKVAGLTALQIGPKGAGGAGTKHLFEDITTYEFQYGINIGAGLQVCKFNNITLQNQNHGDGSNPYPGSQGVLINTYGVAAVTALVFDTLAVQGFETSFQNGTSVHNSGGSDIRVTGLSVFEDLPLNNGAAIKLLSAGPIWFDGVFVEGPGGNGPVGSTRAIVIGAATGDVPGQTVFMMNEFHGFNGAPLIDLHAFDGLVFVGNHFDYSAPSSQCINNIHDGPRSVNGQYVVNMPSPNIAGGKAEPEFHSEDTTGFGWALKSNIYMDGNIEVASSTFLSPSYKITLANNGDTRLAAREYAGPMYVMDPSGYMANAWIRGRYSTAVDIVQATGGGTFPNWNLWSTVQGNAATTNIYLNNGDNTWHIENKTGGNRTYNILAPALATFTGSG